MTNATTLLAGDCLEQLRVFPDASFDSVVTDPPYELGFMGKQWDGTGIAYSVDLWREVLRVLKPGGHLLAFGGTRTYHRMTCAIEDAGFEIRDSLHWMYGTGFPKSLNVSKAIDDTGDTETRRRYAYGPGGEKHCLDCGGLPDSHFEDCRPIETAKQWDGWGTALKPGHEPIVLARKPLEGTVAANVQRYGTGGLNIDGCRIGAEALTCRTTSYRDASTGEFSGQGQTNYTTGSKSVEGRWPANVLLDEAAAAELDAQSGTLKSGARNGKRKAHDEFGTFKERERDSGNEFTSSEGGASRFFYVAKPSRKERDLGCDALPPKSGGEATDREDGSIGVDNPRAGAGRTGGAKNYHPTVKPIELMRYLVRLVTPPGGTVLDPFTGSGTTGIAALMEGARFVGIEREPEYIEIASARIAAATPVPSSGKAVSTHPQYRGQK